MSAWLWVPVLLAAVWAAHWGAEHLADRLKMLRRRWGFSVAAGGAFVGLAAASPEIGINATSVVRGVSDIGLGVMLGSNVLAIPLMVVVGYAATRKAARLPALAGPRLRRRLPRLPGRGAVLGAERRLRRRGCGFGRGLRRTAHGARGC